MADLEPTVKQTAGKYADNSTKEGLTMSKQWLWLTIVAAVVVACT